MRLFLSLVQVKLDGNSFTTYREADVGINGDDAHRFLQLLDGMRTVEELARTIVAAGEVEAKIAYGLKTSSL